MGVQNLNKLPATAVTVKQTAVLKFMSDGSVQVTLTGVDGLNARMVDTSNNLLWQKVTEMRAIARHKHTAASEQKRQAEKPPVVETTRRAQEGDL